VFISIMATLSQGVIGILITGMALVFMVIALVGMNGSWMIPAAILTIPYAYMTGSWSGVLLIVRLLPLTQFLAAYFIDREDKMLAWILALPTLLMLAYSFYDITVNQTAFQILMNQAR